MATSVPRTYSIITLLCRQLICQTLIGLGLVCAGIYAATSVFIKAEQHKQVSTKVAFIEEVISAAARKNGEEAVVAELAYYAPRRPGTFLQVWRADGSQLYQDSHEDRGQGKHWRSMNFQVTLPEGGVLSGRFIEDCAQLERLLARVGITLLIATLIGAAFVGFGTTWRVRRGLRPLRVLACQTRDIMPERLGDRLQLDEPVEELQPWIDQVNGLMDRLQRAYVQLEGFNADVAHELRTPLASMMGQTDVALARARSTEELRETMVSNLEEMQRLSALVNDMLFLSRSDRGAVARRGQAVSLALLAQEVIEFHEAPLAEAGLSVQIDGHVSLAVDEPLVKRALSNLLGNAIRFASPRSRIVIRIEPDASEQVRLEVQNAGPVIAPQHLARLFDRFYRVDSARPDSQSHHGLGLAIVAAIARMHAGRPLAESSDESTRVGFTLAPQ